MNVIIKLYKQYKEIINYIIVGGLTTLVSLVTYYLCVLTFLDPADAIQLQTANMISWIGAVVFAYFANRRFVFESKNKNIANEVGAFVLSRVSTLLMDMGIMFFMVTILQMDDKIVKLFVQVVVVIANYMFSKLFVFANK